MFSRARWIRLVAALVLLAAAWVLLRGYVTDDTYIHLRYARNVIERGEFAFNPGEPTYGATSPLWIFALMLLLKLGLAPLTAVWLLGLLAALLFVCVLDAILERLTFPAAWKLAVILLAVGDVWFLRWSRSGMETPLITALLLVLLLPLVTGRDLGWGLTRAPLWHRYLGWGVAAGLAGLVRPEFLLVAPAALPWLLWFEYYRASAVGGLGVRCRARPHGPLLAAVGGWLAVTGPWFCFAGAVFGRILPETAAAKSGAVTLAPGPLAANLLASGRQLAATQLPLWVTLVVLIGLIIWWARRTPPGAVAPGPTAEKAAAEPGSDAWSVWGPVAWVGIAATWTALLLGGYALKQVWVISRYVSPLSPVLLVSWGLIVEWLLAREGLSYQRCRLCRWLMALGVGATLVWNGGILLTRVLPHARQFSADLQGCYLDLGDWLRVHTPPGTVVAALDIGAVGYASDRRILDLMGLVSPSILALGRDQGFQEMVVSGTWLPPPGAGPELRPDYLVDRCEGAPRWTGRVVRGTSFELLRTCDLAGVGLREPQTWTVALYRLASAGKETETSESTGE